MHGATHHTCRVLAAALVFVTSAALAAPQARGVNVDLAFETSTLMRRTTYRNVPALNADMAPSGAYGPVNQAWEKTRTGRWYIEEQRGGRDLILGGIATGDDAAIKRGLRQFAWGWAQQRPDGSFDCPDAFHSTSFFVEAVAHALLVLEASEYKERYAGRIAAMKPKLLASARWMAAPPDEAKWKKHNAPYAHRRFLVAAALGQTGVLCGDAALVKKSEEYGRDGLALQDAAGFFPEKGGWDSSYNAVGLFYAERYYVLVAGEMLRREMYPVLARGIAWQKSCVNKDGTVSIEGNTRVNALPEKGRNGTPKKIATGSVFRALAYWAQIAGDETYKDLAYQVAEAANMRKKSVK